MRLARIGPVGSEVPVASGPDGAWHDISGIVGDVDGEVLATRVDQISAALGRGDLPEVDGGGRFGPPLSRVGKIVCIGLNYRDHAAETGATIPRHPMLFIKASNTLNDPGADIPLPAVSDRVDYEGELAVVIGRHPDGRPAKDVAAADALAHVFGYTIANDVSARDWQTDRDLGGGQFARGKSFDGFCPLGPAIVTADDVPDPQALSIRTTVNGTVMQDGTTADMICPVAGLIASLSRTMTLRPGQVILTGTPAGVGVARRPPVFLRDGDAVAVEITRLGRLTNTARAAG